MNRDAWIPVSSSAVPEGFYWLLSEAGSPVLGGRTLDGKWVVLSVHCDPHPAAFKITHYQAVQGPPVPAALISS